MPVIKCKQCRAKGISFTTHGKYSRQTSIIHKKECKYRVKKAKKHKPSVEKKPKKNKKQRFESDK